MTKESRIGKKYNPWKSIYTKDYSTCSKRNQPNIMHGSNLRPTTAKINRRTDLEKLNDGVSERSFEVRGDGVNSRLNGVSQKNNFFGKNHDEYGDFGKNGGNNQKSKKIS